MNVTCPNCATIYRVDPAKVPEGGVRARCSICSAVFAVRREGERAAGRPAAARRRAPGVGGPAPAPRPRPRPPQPTRRACHAPAASRAALAAPRAEPAPPAPGASAAEPVAPAGPAHRRGRRRRRARPGRPASRRRPCPARRAPRRRLPPRRPPRPPGACRAGRRGAAGLAAGSAGSGAAPPPPPPPARARPAPATGSRPVNPFLSQDPALKARRLARALISDMVVYHPAKRQDGLRDGNLKELFEEEIKKSWEEYAEQVGPRRGRLHAVLQGGPERDPRRRSPDLLKRGIFQRPSRSVRPPGGRRLARSRPVLDS